MVTVALEKGKRTRARERGHQVLSSLSTPEARAKWAQDPVQYLVAGGFTADLPEEAKEPFRRYLRSLELPAVVQPGLLGVDDDWWSCNGCKIGIGATVFGIFAVVGAAVVLAIAGTGGAAAPEAVAAAPELAEGAAGAGVAAVAAETGLTFAKVAQIFVVAFGAYGMGGVAEAVIEEVCKETGACAA